MALKCLADTPTYRGYETYLGYYSAMTADHWTHLNQAGGSAKTCPSFPDMCLSVGTNLSALRDNSTYESTIFGDRSVALIEAHDAASPFFLYLAFHNEHDPHQAPRGDIDKLESVIRSDTYKVTAAQIATMDLQIGRVYTALQESKLLENAIISFSSDNGGPLDHANNWPHRGDHDRLQTAVLSALRVHTDGAV